ncbi:conserved hypothetical protein [Neospora caninum Liverpool]|nr:conserved hypothetical protein [Neospora caninum Liverpool]CBZ51855.1 conserved hypothetical protein [Neospora caninum Liverpool]|eukprot:XP_003881888.1 conserved hypothetical protein [Neospora caninum Liverpool]
MRRRRQRGVSRTRTAQRLSAGKEVARTEKPAAQACDRDEPAENHLSLDELIDGIHSMKKTASNVMRVWLLIPNEGSMNESLLEKGLLHPEASRSEMSAFQEAYFRLTSAGTEGVLVLNGGFVALEKAMVRAAASYRYTAMDVTHVNSSPSSASVSEWAVLPRASVLSPHPVDAVGIQPGAGLHPVDRPAEKMVMSPKADAQGQLLLPLRRIQKLQRRRRKIRSCALESRASVDTDALLSTTRAFALRDVGQAIATWLFPTKELSETANIHERQGKDHLQVWCPESRRPLQLADINKVITSSQKQQAHQRMPLSISSSGSSSRCDSSSDGTTFLKQAKTVANTTCFVPVCPISSGPHQQLWDFRVPEAHSPSHPPALGSGHPVALSLRQPHLQAPAKGSVATSFDVAAGALLPPSACSEPGRPPHRLVSPMPRCDRGLVQMQGVAPSGSFTRAHLSGSFLVGCAEAAAVQANIVSTSKAPYHTNRDSATNGTTLSKDISTVVNKSYHARMQVAPSLKDGATYNGWTDTSMSPKYSASAPKQKKASIPATLHQEPNSLATTTPTVHLPFV